jgi:hypothetical protein
VSAKNRHYAIFSWQGFISAHWTIEEFWCITAALLAIIAFSKVYKSKFYIDILFSVFVIKFALHKTQILCFDIVVNKVMLPKQQNKFNRFYENVFEIIGIE